MLEITLVIATVVAVGMVGFLTAILTPRLMTAIGLAMLVLGLLVGVPTGFWYHVVLYRFVSAKMPLPHKWWLSPSDLHVHLAESELSRMKPWYVIGGIGFVLSVAGGMAAMAGLLMIR